jgi:hypothetical protein
MTEKQYLKACNEIDRAAVAAEVMKWLVEMVNDYVDNSDTSYQIYFCGDTLELLPQMGALKKLYDDRLGEEGKLTEEEEIESINEFEKIISEVTLALRGEKDKLRELYEKLVFFYDTKIVTDGKSIIPVTEKMEGYIEINDFIFDPFPMGVKVKKKIIKQDKSGKELSRTEEVVKEITIDPGFCVQFELVYWKQGAGATRFSVM